MVMVESLRSEVYGSHFQATDMLCNEACGLRSESHVASLRSEPLRMHSELKPKFPGYGHACEPQASSLGLCSQGSAMGLRLLVDLTSEISDPTSGLRLQALVLGLWSCLRV